MKSLPVVISLFFMSFLLVSCLPGRLVGNRLIVESNKPEKPKWVDQTPAADSDWMYVTGRASELSKTEVAESAAKKQAIQKVFEFLNLKGKSTYYQTRTNDHTQVSDQVEIVTPMFALAGVTVKEFYYEKYKKVVSGIDPSTTDDAVDYYVLLAIPNAELARIQGEQVGILKTAVNRYMDAISEAEMFRTISALRKIKLAETELQKLYAPVTAQIGGRSISDQTLASQIQQKKAGYIQQLRTVVFSVSESVLGQKRPDSQFKQTVMNELTRQNYTAKTIPGSETLSLKQYPWLIASLNTEESGVWEGMKQCKLTGTIHLVDPVTQEILYDYNLTNERHIGSTCELASKAVLQQTAGLVAKDIIKKLERIINE